MWIAIRLLNSIKKEIRDKTIPWYLVSLQGTQGGTVYFLSNVNLDYGSYYVKQRLTALGMNRMVQNMRMSIQTNRQKKKHRELL
ncbi:hypothetical protein AK86_02705 [Streptococcus pneumoniae B1599]|nr:hypothetical protein AK86_02705 [Streptococcus pneumoniae B1599]